MQQREASVNQIKHYNKKKREKNIGHSRIILSEVLFYAD